MHVLVVEDSVNTVLQVRGVSTRQPGSGRQQHTVMRGAKSQRAL